MDELLSLDNCNTKTAERQEQEEQLIKRISQLTEEEAIALIDVWNWIEANNPSAEEITAGVSRIREELAKNSAKYITPAEAKRITMKIGWTEIERRGRQCRGMRFTDTKGSPHFCSALTTAAVYESGRIDGIRAERARRNHKH